MRFWYHHGTGASQWETPSGVDDAAVAEDDVPLWEDAQEVTEVHDLNDLGI